jgi:hypothetical protein
VHAVATSKGRQIKRHGDEQLNILSNLLVSECMLDLNILLCS